MDMVTTEVVVLVTVLVKVASEASVEPVLAGVATEVADVLMLSVGSG